MNNNTEPDWEFLDLAAKIEKDWKKSFPKFTDAELLRIFPEAKAVIPHKIIEIEKELRHITNTIKNKLREIDKKHAQENQWFWKAIIKQIDGQRLVETQRHLRRLRRQLAVAQNRKPRNGAITEMHIQQALSVSLIEIAARYVKLRKSSQTFAGLCPFHNEKTPSFHVYPRNNRFYCYGCQKGGNVINFIRELEGFSFREAITYLTQ